MSKTNVPALATILANIVPVAQTKALTTLVLVPLALLVKIVSKTSDLAMLSTPARTAVSASPMEVATVALAKGDSRERRARNLA